MMRDEYFEWMLRLVCGDEVYRKPSYRKLLRYLDSVEFVYIIDKDDNRAEDGIGLRYQFGYENGYSDSDVKTELDITPCSIFEMMVALCVRCENSIMKNTEMGDRTGQWFWGMIVNLGLGGMHDNKFDAEYIQKVLDDFLYRRYEKDGSGGLFTVKERDCDMRSTEIWYQMCWYLNEI